MTVAKVVGAILVFLIALLVMSPGGIPAFYGDGRSALAAVALASFFAVGLPVWVWGRKRPWVKRWGWVLLPLGLAGLVSLVIWAALFYIALGEIGDPPPY